MKPSIIFFSRDYQANLFPLIKSDFFTSLHVTLLSKEKKIVESKGGKVVGCLEEDFEKIKLSSTDAIPKLLFSFNTDRFLRGYSYEERVNIIRLLSKFWCNIIDEYKPIAVINEPIALEISEMLWIEATKRNIRYLALATFNFGDFFYFLPDPTKNTSFKSIIQNLRSGTNKDLAYSYIDYIKNGNKPNYVLNLPARNSFSTFKASAKNLFYNLFQYFLIRDNLKRQLLYHVSVSRYFNDMKLYLKSFLFSGGVYNDLSYLEDKIFYFFPLHYEPEAVISYGSYFHSEQLHVILNVLKCLPQDQFLIVKEHPQQPFHLLSSSFINLKSVWPNLIFLKSDVSSFTLINKCKAIVTLGGTLGFEALTLGKNVINFGNVYYDSFEGVINIKEFEQLYFLLRDSASFPQLGDIYDFTSKLFSILYKGNPFPCDHLFDHYNLESITKAIESELFSRD